jgi:hypothetical protein
VCMYGTAQPFMIERILTGTQRVIRPLNTY